MTDEEQDGHGAMRRLMIAIRNDSSLDAAGKARKMQEAMTQRFCARASSPAAAVVAGTPQVAAAVLTGDQDEPGFHDAERGVLGCRHYSRRCRIWAACCSRFFGCRQCHDEAVRDHAYDRYATERVKCMECHEVQSVSAACRACNKPFAKYFCSVCKFYDDAEDKDIFHCDKCKMCRIGKGLGIDFFHCDRCNACMSLAMTEHKCVERSLESDCPICHEFMFTSTTPVMFLKCGHCMHVHCYEQYTQTQYTCPICCKSVGDMREYFARIDRLIQAQPMPRSFRHVLSHILCSDCGAKGTATYHFVGHKCGGCGSYNTKVTANEGMDGAIASERAEGAAPIPPTAAIAAAAARPAASGGRIGESDRGEGRGSGNGASGGVNGGGSSASADGGGGGAGGEAASRPNTAVSRLAIARARAPRGRGTRRARQQPLEMASQPLEAVSRLMSMLRASTAEDGGNEGGLERRASSLALSARTEGGSPPSAATAAAAGDAADDNHNAGLDGDGDKVSDTTGGDDGDGV
eukprot:g6490.t1